MKNLLLLILIFTLTKASSLAQPLNTDPTFSERNYKHVNKAEKAKSVKRTPEKMGSEEYVRPARNFKSPKKIFNKFPMIVVANYNSSRTTVSKNYKQHFDPRPAIDEKEEIRKFLEEIREVQNSNH